MVYYTQGRKTHPLQMLYDRYRDSSVDWCHHYLHAEMNAILNALYNGSSVKGSTIFVSGLPVCNECAKAIIQAGIKKVVMDTKLDPESKWCGPAKISMEMFKEAGVEVEFV